MTGTQNLEQNLDKLLEPELSMQQRYELAKAVGKKVIDILEIVSTPKHLKFLKSGLSVFLGILACHTKPQETNNVEHKLRNVSVEILSRLCQNKVAGPFARELLTVARQVLRTDNEENGIVCLRIVLYLHRNFTPTLEPEVQPFLDFVRTIYQNFEATVKYLFDDSIGNESQLGTTQRPIGNFCWQRPPGKLIPRKLIPSTQSFKIVTELPSIVMFLFKVYSGYIDRNIPVLLPLMVNAISIPGPQHVPPYLKNYDVEMKHVQAKIVSFLTCVVLLNRFDDSIRPHEDCISKSIVNLFDTCPDSALIRKELLVATKYLLETDLRRGFFPFIDTLLKERILVQTGRACFERLMPLEYSVLEDFIAHFRMEFSLNQLSQIIYLFSRNMHDSSLPLSLQTTCAKLMLNLVELIFNKSVDPASKEDRRALLVHMLDACVRKFGTTKCTIRQAVLNLQMPLEQSEELNRHKQLIKTLVMGMNKLVWSITHVDASQMQLCQPSSVDNPLVLKGMREEEVQFVSAVLKSGVNCLTVFKDEEEENEVLEHFSQIFAVMQPRNLMDMFAVHMQHIFEYMLYNNQLLVVFSALLQTSTVVRYFADVLVNFLVSNKLGVLRQPDSPASKLVLHLFRLLTDAAVKFPGDCECFLLPYASTIMEVCMKNVTEIENPQGYMQLLCALFCALSGVKFESSFRKFIPTLQPCLNMLLSMVEGPTGVDMKDLVLELCLRLPARLSSLIPHLPRLMKALVLALKGSDELIDLGLRTLEFWIDSINPVFWESSTENIMSEVILTLWSHIRPKPYRWGEKALQLLGKLGGRNRKFVKQPSAHECKENSENGLLLILTFEPSTSFLMPLDRCIHLAIEFIMQNRSGVDTFYKRHALKFLHVCLSSVLNLKKNIGAEEVTPELLSTMLMSSIDPSRHRTDASNIEFDVGGMTKTQFMAERSVFKVLLMTVIAATAEAEFQDPKDDFVPNVCRHFAMIFHVDSSTTPSVITGQLGGLMGIGSGGLSSKSWSSSHGNFKELDPLIFLDALVDVLTAEDRAHANAALNAMNIFVETLLLLACCKHMGVQRDVGTPGTPMMLSSPSMNPIYSPSPGVRIPIFEQLLHRLLHCCYGRTWHQQMGGVMGLGALVGKATVDTLCLFQVQAVRGLVYVLKRLPQHANKEQEETSQVLTDLLRVVNNVDEDNSERCRQSYQGVVDFLAAELFNPNATLVVRKNVQSCLALLASQTGSEVTKLLEPRYQPLLQPLIMHPLRNKHIEQQVGTVMALKFCLALQPPLLKMTQELVNILQEALQITEVDETVLVEKFMDPKLAETSTKLRIACIELLCTAMDCTDFTISKHRDLQSRIISMFFKSLTCLTPEIVVVAKDGLRQAIRQKRLSQELLKTSLRPISLNLVDIRNLTIPLLQGLGHILDLLSNTVQLSFGENLLEYLKKWLEPEKLAQSQKAWKTGAQPNIAAAIIELFHLLPPKAAKFLDDLVALTMEIETTIPQGQVYSELNSPYRLPLTKFLNRFASDAVDYFLVRLNQPKHFRRFMDIIRSEAGQPLREELAKSPNKIVSNAFLQSTAANEGQMADVHFQGISLVSDLVKLMPYWLSNNRPVFDALVLMWKSHSRRLHVKESKKLVKCFLNYLRHNKSEVAVLFDMLSVFLDKTHIDYTFLKFFYMTEVAEGYTPQMKKEILLYFLNVFQSKKLTQGEIVIAMQILILPMLVHAFQNGQKGDVVSPSIVKAIFRNLLDPPEKVIAEYDEPLRIEILQLATLLLKYIPNDLVDHKKALGNLVVNCLTQDNSPSKLWAIVTVCQYLKAYEADAKTIPKVFLDLLRMSQPENKGLVNRALDILIPALPRILSSGENKIPLWIRQMKEILVEEWHSVANLIHIFQLILRHSYLFYSYRAQFVPQMLKLLSHLGLRQSTSPENRHLAIELAGLVVAWEKQRQTESKVASDTEGHVPPMDMPISTPGARDYMIGVAVPAKRPPDASGFSDILTKRFRTESDFPILRVMPPGDTSILNTSTPVSVGQPDEDYKPNAAMQEMIVNFLIKVSLFTEAKDKEKSVLYKQTLELLSQSLEVWPTVNVKINYLERWFSLQYLGQNKDPSTFLAKGLDVMNKVLEKQPHLFIQNNLQQITQLLESCFNSQLSDIRTPLCTLLKIVFHAFPIPFNSINAPQEIRPLLSKVEELIRKHLAEAAVPQITPEINSANLMISFALSVIKTLAEGQESFIDAFMMPLICVLQRLTGELGTITSSVAKQKHVAVIKKKFAGLVQAHRTDQESPSASVHLESNSGAVTFNLKSILKLVSRRVMLLPECKNLISQILEAILCEKDADASLLLTILDMIKDWVENDFGSSSGTPSVVLHKDVIWYLQKLSEVDTHSLSTPFLEEWDGKYLQLLYRLCSDSAKYPLPIRQEVFQKVEKQYMLGLAAKDPEMQKQFFALYHDSLGKTLFSRLQYVIQTQEWEALSDVFWLKHGLDLLLATLIEHEPITLAPYSAQVPPVMALRDVPGHAGMQQVGDAPEGTDETLLAFIEIVNKHAKFLNETAKLQVADVLIPLRELAHTDADVAYHLWVLVFPIVWASLQIEQQEMLDTPMITLLSKYYHSRQQNVRPNVVQALLEGLSLSWPLPKIPCELIKFLGKTYNAWHIAISLLESHVMQFPDETHGSNALSELYCMLNEEDVRYGLWKKRAITAETQAGLSLVQHGYWQPAQDIFSQAISKATQGTYNNNVSKAEMCFFEEQWISCAQHLNQWEELVDYAKNTENYEILLDCLWKIPDWMFLQDNVCLKAQVEDTMKFHIVQAYLALHDGNATRVTEAANRLDQGVDLALNHWWQLPEMSVQSHVPLLQQFQQLVELQESARVLVEIGNGNKQQVGTAPLGGVHYGYVDLKAIFETWKLRTPNKWDTFSVWNDLLQWRNHMYDTVMNAFKDYSNTNSQLHQLAYRDKAWSVNKLAHVARKQGHYDVCITVLNKMDGLSTMEVQEAFVKIREQAKASLEITHELINGINLINSTDLGSFPDQYRAEIFCLKGEFWQKQNDSESAGCAYSHAISLSKDFSKGWITWGIYCDQLYKKTNEEHWLEYAVCCFLEGIKHGVSNARSHLARVLYLLSFDTQNEPVGKVFDKHLDQIPHWVWLSWIPQLLLSLQRPEAAHCKLVLLRIARVYPQAIYYLLRTYFLECHNIASKSQLGRESLVAQHQVQWMPSSVARYATNSMEINPAASHPRASNLTSKVVNNQLPQGGSLTVPHDGSNLQGQESDRTQTIHGNIPAGLKSSQTNSASIKDSQGGIRRNAGLCWGASALMAFNNAKDIMKALKNKHPNLASELEVFLTEIESRFVPVCEERLLAVVHELLHKCYQYPIATTTEVPQSLKKELSAFCRYFSQADTVNKHVEFVNEYKQDFERDFDPDNKSTFPSTLYNLIKRLIHWKNVLRINVEDRFPAVLKLEEESRALRDFHVVDVEVPGQYFADQEIAPGHRVKLDRFGADLHIVRRHGTSSRRLTIVGSDGSQRHFLVQTLQSPTVRSDERIVQLFRVLNKLFDKHKESRSRHLAFHTPIIIPVRPQVRMVEDDLMFGTFGEVYEIDCARHHREVDYPVIYFKENLNQAIIDQLPPESVADLRLRIYNEITSKFVKENVFCQFMYRTLPSFNYLWAFRKQFAVQLALSGFMSHVLQIGGQTPKKVLFAKNTGKVFHIDFHPAYDANGMIELNEPVPFRLTRNLQTFFTPFGVEGIFVSAMCAAAQSIVALKSQHVQHHLAMLFRDELLPWFWRKPSAMPSEPISAGAINPVDFEQKVTTNVEQVITRIKSIAPQCFLEKDENATQPLRSVQRGVTELVEAALQPKNLCMMDPTWHPWF